MRTSALLPEECREEIRELLATVGVDIASWKAHDGLGQGGEWLLHGWRNALERVLNDKEG